MKQRFIIGFKSGRKFVKVGTYEDIIKNPNVEWIDVVNGVEI